MIAILGAGKMGEALLSGMLRAGVAPSGVIAAVRRRDRAEALRDSYGLEVTHSARDRTDSGSCSSEADTVCSLPSSFWMVIS